MDKLAQPDSSTQGPPRRGPEHETLTTALTEALRALAQAITGDTAPVPPDIRPSQESGKANLNASNRGVRLDVSQMGPGGDDTPPDRPSAGDSEPVLGKPTQRLAAQLRQVAAGAAHSDQDPGTGEGLPAATQAQAARVEFAATQASTRAASEAALTRSQVPVAYRASVKRYFVQQHADD